MAATVASPAMKRLDLRDPAALFETHGAEEIRGLERQVRAEIEHKKEELRQMVGERYRDLIEAADTIGQMRRCADGLVDAVRATDQYCARLRQADPAASRPQPVREQQPSQEKFYSMAAQIKLLLDIPEKMWSAMEASQYLHATQLYLLCCYLHSLLQLNSAQTLHSPVLSRFPILIQQVAAASHFRSTILHESKKLLKCHTVPDQAVAEALCSIMLLEESSPRQALTDFLLARKTAIQKLLQQLHHDGGAKAQICLLVEVMATTLNQAHALFYTLPEGHLPDPSLPCGLLFSTLETITGQQPTGRGIPILQEGMKLCSWSRYLPPSIVEFQPALRTLAHPISQEFLKDTLQKWIHMCSEDIKNGLNNLLRFVKNIHDLAEVRDAMWRLLASESTSHSWNVVCQRLLEKPFLFWEDLMQQLFLHRLQTLMKEGFAAISSSCRELLISALHELEPSTSSSTPNKHIHLEHNMSLFLWTESPSDLPPDAAWVSVANRAEFAGSGLARKAHNISPCVQSFCSVLDSKLKGQLDDLLAYLPPDKASLPRDGSPKNCAFDRYSDAGTVQDVLQTHSVACIQTITSCISDELQRAEGLHRQQEGGTASRLHAVLFMARLCQSLGDLCPHLKQCILGKSGSTEKPARELRTLKKLGKGSAPEAVPLQSKWQEVRGLLLQQSVAAYRVWSSALVNALETESQMEMRPFSLEKGYLLFKALVQGFTQSLLLDDAASVLAMATSWEELEIQEETESGSSVTSKIRLPVQPSWCVQAFLFTLCQEINRVGGHALPKVTLQETLKNCMVQIVSAYERLSEEKETKREGAIPVTQNQALQLLYDVRYLSIVLTSRSEEKGGRNKQDPRTEKVINYLEALIDPFDLDVFTPHLNSNLTRLVQRTSVLFGLVAGTDSPFTPRSSTFNSQEPHNILPLAASQIRFGLLPLSMTSTRKTKATSRSTETHVQVVPPALSQADDPMHPGSLFRQLVSEEGDTSTPSLFRLSWLSSMTK